MSLTKILELLPGGKLWIAAAAVVVVLAAGAVMLWAGFRRPPDPAKQTPEQVLEYVASENFAALSSEQKQDYLTRARQEGRLEMRQMYRAEGLSDPQREQLRRNMADVGQQRMEQMQGRMMDEYFELPPEDRVEYLDRMIDRMQDYQTRAPGGDGDRHRAPEGQDRSFAAGDDDGREAGGRPRGRGRGLTPERMKQRIEHSDPEVRARRAEFMKAFRERMEQRGVTFRGRSR